jgi:hypothetical protein
MASKETLKSHNFALPLGLSSGLIHARHLFLIFAAKIGMKNTFFGVSPGIQDLHVVKLGGFYRT